MADDTPTIFPVPTRDAVETISAPKEEMPLPLHRLFVKDSERFDEKANLREPHSNRQEQACGYQEEWHNEGLVEKIAKSRNDIVNGVYIGISVILDKIINLKIDF